MIECDRCKLYAVHFNCLDGDVQLGVQRGEPWICNIGNCQQIGEARKPIHKGKNKRSRGGGVLVEGLDLISSGRAALSTELVELGLDVPTPGPEEDLNEHIGVAITEAFRLLDASHNMLRRIGEHLGYLTNSQAIAAIKQVAAHPDHAKALSDMKALAALGRIPPVAASTHDAGPHVEPHVEPHSEHPAETSRNMVRVMRVIPLQGAPPLTTRVLRVFPIVPHTVGFSACSYVLEE